MPELPEVEVGRKLAEATAVGRRIVRAWCADDRIVYAGVSPATVRRRLKGREVVAAVRRGKYIWLELDQRPWPLFHFGMTGAFRVPDKTPLPLRSSPRRPDGAWPPRFCKILLWLDDGGELAMTNARRLGRIRLRDDPPREPPVSELGFDPLLDLPAPQRFSELLGRRRGALKGVLLDQSFAAGVGNWIADEVLYQARLHPRRTVASLRPGEIARLRTCLRRVVHTAVAVDARKELLPRTWLFHRRWDDGGRTAGGDRIVRETIAGRTTAFVPARQR